MITPLQSFVVTQGANNYLNVSTTDTTENISFGNATTNPTFSFLGSGLATFTGGVTVNGAFNANNASTFTPNDANDVTFTTDSNSTVRVTGLADTTGTPLCLNSSNDLITCSGQSVTLQNAYTNGNTITTTDARNIGFTLADTATDSLFTVTTAAGGAGYTYLSLADGANTAPPAQALLIENLDTNEALPAGIKIQSAAGLITTAIDLSDAEIGNALSLGANDITATQWSVTGSSGLITTAGDIAVNGGDITSSAATFNLANSGVTTVNIGGAATTNFGGGYGTTGVSITSAGNLSANGTLTVDGTSLLTGNVTAGADLEVQGGDITTNQTTFNLLNATATTLNIGGAAGTIAMGAGTGTTTLSNNLRVNLVDNNTDALDIQQGTDNYININTTDTTENISFGNTNTNPTFSFLGTGLATFNGGATIATGTTLTANGPVVIDPDSTNDVTFTTDANSTVVFNGLQTTTGSVLCRDSSNNLVVCSSSSISLQAAYNAGNTITTTDARNIGFTLADTATDSLFTVTTAAGGAGYTYLSLADGTNTAPPTQALLIENLDTNEALPAGIKIQSAAGLITTAIDLSDAEIGNALSLGANDITATQWSVTGSSGLITTAGNVAVNGGDLTTTDTTANLFNTGATSLNIGGAATTLPWEPLPEPLLSTI